jgi:type III restriction enzyme
VLTLADWRKQFRFQQVAFRLAREVCRRWDTEQNGGGESDVAASTSQLFPKVAFAAKRFLQEKVKLIGNADPRDVLHASKYHQQAVDIIFEAIRRDGITRTRELPRIAKGSAGRGSTRFVDYHTTKEVYPASRCHLNAMVADTKSWEQSAGYALDTHPGVVCWVKK